MFRQALSLGGNVRKGEHGTTVVYADRFVPDDEKRRARETGEEAAAIPFLKRFTVFNAAQCENLPAEVAAVAPPPLPGLIEPSVEALTVRHADYIGSWLDVLRDDNRAVVRAASQASKAADWTVAAEGWKWIEVAIDFPYGHTHGLRALEGVAADLTSEEQATIDALKAEAGIVLRQPGKPLGRGAALGTEQLLPRLRRVPGLKGVPTGVRPPPRLRR